MRVCRVSDGMTVRKAIQTLVDEERLYIVRVLGTFVSRQVSRWGFPSPVGVPIPANIQQGRRVTRVRQGTWATVSAGHSLVDKTLTCCYAALFDRCDSERNRTCPSLVTSGRGVKLRPHGAVHEIDTAPGLPELPGTTKVRSAGLSYGVSPQVHG